MWDVLTTGNDFACIIVFFSTTLCITVFARSLVAHDLILPSVCVPGGHIPDGFWVVWEGPPYRPHSLGDGSKCRRGKGLKTVCIAPTRTSERYIIFAKL